MMLIAPRHGAPRGSALHVWTATALLSALAGCSSAATPGDAGPTDARADAATNPGDTATTPADAAAPDAPVVEGCGRSLVDTVACYLAGQFRETDAPGGREVCRVPALETDAATTWLYVEQFRTETDASGMTRERATYAGLMALSAGSGGVPTSREFLFSAGHSLFVDATGNAAPRHACGQPALLDALRGTDVHEHANCGVTYVRDTATADWMVMSFRVVNDGTQTCDRDGAMWHRTSATLQFNAETFYDEWFVDSNITSSTTLSFERAP